MFVYVRCNDKNKIWARKWRTEMNTHMKTLLNILIAITNVGSKHSNILTERDLDLKIKKFTSGYLNTNYFMLFKTSRYLSIYHSTL